MKQQIYKTKENNILLTQLLVLAKNDISNKTVFQGLKERTNIMFSSKCCFFYLFIFTRHSMFMSNSQNREHQNISECYRV